MAEEKRKLYDKKLNKAEDIIVFENFIKFFPFRSFASSTIPWLSN